jgi:hypothetical protein
VSYTTSAANSMCRTAVQLVFGNAGSNFNELEGRMKSVIALALIAGFGMTAIAVHAAPVRLSKAQMDQVVAGSQVQQGCCSPGQFPGGKPNTNPANTPSNK